jgi:hypothetical protein
MIPPGSWQGAQRAARIGRIDCSKWARGEGVGEGSGVAVGGSGVGIAREAVWLPGLGAGQLKTSTDVRRTSRLTSRIDLVLRMVFVEETPPVGRCRALLSVFGAEL